MIYPSHELLESYERCNRYGIYAREWRKIKISPQKMLMEGIREGILSDSRDFGQTAGERCFELAVNPGLDSKQYDLHAETVHVCSLADVVTSAIRKDEPWTPVGPIEVGNGSIWESDAYLEQSGDALRRVVCVSSWSDDRHFSLCRSWGSLGTVCLHNLPMKIAVVLVGAHRDGRYHSHWSRGFLHPVNRKLRFRKKSDGNSKFKDSWTQVWREDRDEITTHDWLQSMHTDGVLEDSLILVDLPVPDAAQRQKICDLAARRLDQIENTERLPEQHLSTCDWPVKCDFISPCWREDTPNGRYGFVPVGELT